MDNLFTIGRIRKGHGLFGYMKVQSFSGKYNHFKGPEFFYIKKNGTFIKYPIEDIKLSGEKTLIKLKGVDNIDDTKKFSNCEIWVDKKNLNNKEKDEFYYFDLVDCKIFFKDFEKGFVKSIVEAGDAIFLEIENINQKKVLIPFIKKFIGKCDIKNKKIELLEECVLDED